MGNGPTPSFPAGDRERLGPAGKRLLARARREWDRGDLDAAERSLQCVLALAPDHPDADRLVGMLAARRGDHQQAVDRLLRVVAARPDDTPARIELAHALDAQDRSSEAIFHLRQACKLTPDSAAAWFTLGTLFARHANPDEAVEAMVRAAELDPAHLQTQLALARLRAMLGQIDAAVGTFRTVLRRQPDNAEAWFGLSNLNVVRFTAGEAEQLRAIFSAAPRSASDFEMVGFAFAKALEDQGDYAQAFDVFERVNRSRRAHAGWDAAGGRARANAILHAFRADLPPPPDPTFGAEAIFIASMPRSGSSLVEQILASHPAVEGANEIMDLAHVLDAEAGRRGAAFPTWVSNATAQDWHRLGGVYLARTARWRKVKPRFTDKSLVNWYLAGAALAMLPAARLVVVWRDAVETCLGCYRQCFDASNGFGSDLLETADYYIDFAHLSRFWSSRFPGRVYDLQYEALVADPATEIRRLLEFCSLPFDPRCLTFHDTARAVRSSPSSAQVRQVLRRDTARSFHYGDRLAALRERLRDAGVLADRVSADADPNESGSPGRS